MKKPQSKPAPAAGVTFSQEVAEEFCRRVSNGQTTKEVSRMPDMPSWSSVCLWLRQKPDFARQVQQARHCLADCLFDETLQIADNATAQSERVDRLKIDSRKWLVAKMHPSRYGDKIEPVNVVVNQGPEHPVTQAQRDAAVRTAMLLAAHEGQGHSEGSGTPH
jgi:hypothetical protein